MYILLLTVSLVRRLTKYNKKMDAFLELKIFKKQLFNDVENALSTNKAMSHDYMNSYVLDFTIWVTSRESLSYEPTTTKHPEDII